VGAELLVEGAVHIYPLVGTLVVFVAALNGIAVLQAYFRLFGGTEFIATIPLGGRPQEQIAVLTLSALILGGGLIPQPGVTSRYHAAIELIERRQVKAAPAEEGHASSYTTAVLPAEHRAAQLPNIAQPE
jgi:NADH-quinone oxidoreductase subunit M